MTLLAASGDSSNLNPMSFCDQHGTVILDRLRYLRETGKFTDVVIVVGGRQFAAHRCILAASSPYFDSILKHKVVCKEMVRVNWKKATVFDTLLGYFYSGNIVIDRASVADLLQLANSFLVPKVKSYCAEYLGRTLDAANALSIKSLAAKFNLPSLLKAASDFFDTNINRCMVECVDMLEWPYEKIRKLIVDSKYTGSIFSDSVLRLATRWASSGEGRSGAFRALLPLCHLNRVKPTELDYALSFSPLLTKDRSFRLLFLREMNRCGVPLGKWSDEYSSLSASGICSFSASLPLNNVDNDYSDDYSDGEPMVEGAPTADEILADGREPFTVSSEEVEEGAPVRLKIKLGSIDRKAEKAQRKEKKRRKRRVHDEAPGPSKTNGEPNQDEVDGVFSFGEESALFPEPDGIDPATVQDNEEEENVHGGQFMCLHCRFATNETEDFHRHMARRHNRNTIFVCTNCPEGECFEANWSHSFYEHAAQHFHKTLPLRCHECDYATEEGIHELLSHQLCHTSCRPFKCAECGWRGRTRNGLWSHERIHSGEAVAACSDCGRSFHSHDALASHNETHAIQRLHVCVDCGWATSTEADLLNHRAASHQVDVYSCHISGCDYVSTKKSQLAAHLRTHLAVRAHLCRICGRGFIEKSHVVRHERIHLQDKPFKCESCDYASSRRDKLKEHILKYHNGLLAGGKQVQRRRYRRAKQMASLAQAAARTAPRSGADVLFRPIESNRDRVQQWQNSLLSHGMAHTQAPRALSVAPFGQAAAFLAPPSPGSMSLVNVPLRDMGMSLVDSPILHGRHFMDGTGMEETPLVTPVPRSPHNHSETFPLTGAEGEEGQRPMSLPPSAYGREHNWFT